MKDETDMINLGRKWESPCEEPESPEEKISYPSLYISDLDAPMELGAEGKAVVKFKKVSESNRKGKYSCELEIHAIKFLDKKPKEKTVQGIGENFEVAIIAAGGGNPKAKMEEENEDDESY